MKERKPSTKPWGLFHLHCLHFLHTKKYPVATISNVTLRIPVGRVSIPNRLPVSTNDAKSAIIILCSSNALPLTPHFNNHMTAHLIPYSPLPLISRIRNPHVFRHKHNTCQYRWRLLLLLCSALLLSSPPQTNNSINAIPLLHIYEITRLAQLTPHSHLHSTSRIDSLLLPTKMKHQTLTNALMMMPIHVLVVSWFQTNKKPLRIRPNHLRSGRWGVIDKCKLLVMWSTWRVIERGMCATWASSPWM
jgi:hypothetical protein